VAILLRNPLAPGGASAFSRLAPRPPIVAGVIAVAFRHPTPPVSRVPAGARIAPVERGAGSVGPPVARFERDNAGFVSPKVDKGRLTNLRTRRAHFFMFNPTEINRTDGWSWSSHRVPGASHPVVSGGSGGDRKISFTLYFDADRGRSDSRREGTGEASLDLTMELNAWRSMTYPQDSRSNSLPERGPGRFILNYGPLFNGIEVVVDSVNVNVISMTPKLQPMRAVVSIDLTEVVRKSIFSTDELRLPATSGKLQFDLGTALITSSEAFDVVEGGEIDNGGAGPL